MKKNALIVTWTGFSDEELIYCYYRLLEDNFSVKIISNVVSYEENKKPLKGVNGCSFHSNLSISVFDSPISIDLLEKYDLLIIPGGVKALEKLRLEKSFISFVSEWNKKGKVIGSICWGAQILISAKCVNNREISGYYSLQDDIENAGATYIDLPAVIDDNIVSTAHYKDLGPWMKAVLEVYYAYNK